MTRRRPCIYCRVLFRATMLTTQPVLPAELGGRLALKRAACPDCAARVRGLTDDFLATRFALTTAAMAAKGRTRPTRERVGRTSDLPPARASQEDWRRAYRAAAKILYCYLLLELGRSVLSRLPSEMLRRHVMDESLLSGPSWEVTPAAISPSARWHVLMFDSAHSSAAVGLFGTIWFRFNLDLGSLAPHGRLFMLDAFRGARGMALIRSRRGWRHRTSVRWGWND